jgi:hypothetical protein
MLALGQRFEVKIEDVRIPKREIVGLPTDESLLGDPRDRDRAPRSERSDRGDRGDRKGRPSRASSGRSERSDRAARDERPARPARPARDRDATPLADGERRRDRRAARRLEENDAPRASQTPGKKPSKRAKKSAISHANPFAEAKKAKRKKR